MTSPFPTPNVEYFEAEGVISARGVLKFSPGCDARIFGDGTFTTSKRELTSVPVGTKVKATFRLAGATEQRRLVAVQAINEGLPFQRGNGAVKVKGERPAPKVDKNRARNRGYYVPEEIDKVFDAALSVAQTVGMFAAMMTGPSGYGKTSLPYIIAKGRGLNVVRVDCSIVRDPEEWFGTRQLVGGETKFTLNEFAEAVQAGDCIIILDEINRPETPIANGLFRFLDSGTVHIHGHTIQRGPNVLVVGTMNQGYQYTGTFQADEALLNRFGATIQVGPLPPEEEAAVLKARGGVPEREAEIITRVLGVLRRQELSVDVSTRVSLNIARLVCGGLTIPDAFQFAVQNRCEPHEQKAIIDAVNTQMALT